MPRENNYHALILKKQPFGEGDELITVFTKEAGKLRVLAKSVKLAKSKLSFSLQSLFVVQLRTTNSTLPKVIGAEVLQTFSRLREQVDTVSMAAYAAELVLKFSPDEQPNEAVFASVVGFLSFLDSTHPQTVLAYALVKFKIIFLDAAGFAIQYDANTLKGNNVGFSNSYGGFFTSQAVDYVPVAQQTLRQFAAIKNASFGDIAAMAEAEDVRELQNLLSDFLRYHLEREIKSEEAIRFLQG